MSTDRPIICFDLGGVVVRICRNWEQACARAGVAAREPARFADPARASLRREITHAHQTGAMDCAAYYQAIARATGDLYSADEVRAVHDAWLIEDYPGMTGLIERLHALGLTTACLSNTNHAHWVRLKGIDRPAMSRAIPLLRVPMVSHQMKAAKPHAEIYAIAQATLGVPPHRIVFFDDLRENIDAARSRGWHAHQIDPEGDTAAQIARHLQDEGVRGVIDGSD